MKTLITRRSLAKALTGGSFAALTIAIGLGSAQIANAQYRYVPEHRRPIDETLHNLDEISEHTPHDRRDQRRYDMARKHLYEFAGRLQQGFWDDRKLSEAIGDVREVAEDNPMDRRAREILRRDAEELRHLRERHDERYRYPY